jgi:hypothetical protein
MVGCSPQSIHLLEEALMLQMMVQCGLLSLIPCDHQQRNYPQLPAMKMMARYHLLLDTLMLGKNGKKSSIQASTSSSALLKSNKNYSRNFT